MKATWYFTRKELMEAFRSYHILIIVIVFVIFGIEGPLMAKLTPDILKMASTGGITIKMPDPTSIDSWQQYYKNITQIGMYVLIVIFSGTVSSEVARGTLVNLVTKGLPRYAVILSKYIVAYLQWFVAIVLAFLINWGYTLYYFPDDKSPNIWNGLWPLLVFGLLFVAVAIFGSSMGRSNYLGFLMSVVAFVVMSLLNLFEDIHKYNPASLVTNNVSLVKGSKDVADILPAAYISILLACVFVYLAILILNKKKL